VIAVDNFFTGAKANVEHLRNFDGFELIRHDITLPLFIEVDGIFNLACPASPVHYQKNPVQTLKASVLGSINLLGLAKRTGSRILQASTSEVYGDPTISPQSEEYWGNVNPHGIRACYDEGKRAAEALFMDYQRQHGTQIKIARIFNTYGPRMAINDGRVVSNFIVQALKNQPITIYGDGSQTRSFCYVSDLIQGLQKLFFSSPELNQPINLGNPNECSMLELASIVKGLTNSNSKIEYLPLPEDDPKQRKPDISKARNTLGWNPSVALEEGLGLTTEYFARLV
jgi:UDP-glucuronate decarboxylase